MTLIEANVILMRYLFDTEAPEDVREAMKKFNDTFSVKELTEFDKTEQEQEQV